MDTAIRDDIARVIAEAEQQMTQAAASLLDAGVSLAIARHEIHGLKRRLAAGESLRGDDAHSAQSELHHACLELTEIAELLVDGAQKLVNVVGDVRRQEPRTPPS